MSKKGNLSISSKRVVEGSEKDRVGVCSVYTTRHCLQGPCLWQQGPASFNITGKTDICTLPINMPNIFIVLIYYCPSNCYKIFSFSQFPKVNTQLGYVG